MRSLLFFVHLVLVVIILAACGGGDGDSGGDADSNGSGGTSAPKATINEDNAENIAALFFTISSGLLNAGSSVTGMIPVQPTPSAASITGQVARVQLDYLTESAISPDLARLTQTVACNGGGKTTVEMNDGFQLNAGDTMSVAYDNCITIFQDFRFTLNGRMDMTYISVPDGSSSLNFSVKIQYSNLTSIFEDTDAGTVYSTSMDGGWEMVFAQNGNVFESSISSDGITIVSNGITTTLVNLDQSFVFDLSTETYTAEYNFTVTSSAYPGTFSIQTPVPLQGSIYGNPETGTLRISAPDGSSVELNADTGDTETVIITVNNGSSTTSREVTWAELYQGASF
ncbi:MAG: hypothetical protein U9R74_17275 [Pseudomonadota bacterium]|nr:hypothetical protein [Pseudomonadota bacterium]